MKVEIGGVIFDAHKEQITLVFDDTDSARTHANNILNMTKRSGPIGDMRLYQVGPADQENNLTMKEKYSYIKSRIKAQAVLRPDTKPDVPKKAARRGR